MNIVSFVILLSLCYLDLRVAGKKNSNVFILDVQMGINPLNLDFPQYHFFKPEKSPSQFRFLCEEWAR